MNTNSCVLPHQMPRKQFATESLRAVEDCMRIDCDNLCSSVAGLGITFPRRPPTLHHPFVPLSGFLDDHHPKAAPEATVYLPLIHRTCTVWQLQPGTHKKSRPMSSEEIGIQHTGRSLHQAPVPRLVERLWAPSHTILDVPAPLHHLTTVHTPLLERLRPPSHTIPDVPAPLPAANACSNQYLPYCHPPPPPPPHG